MLDSCAFLTACFLFWMVLDIYIFPFPTLPFSSFPSYLSFLSFFFFLLPPFFFLLKFLLSPSSFLSLPFHISFLSPYLSFPFSTFFNVFLFLLTPLHSHSFFLSFFLSLLFSFFLFSPDCLSCFLSPFLFGVFPYFLHLVLYSTPLYSLQFFFFFLSPTVGQQVPTSILTFPKSLPRSLSPWPPPVPLLLSRFYTEWFGGHALGGQLEELPWTHPVPCPGAPGPK